MRLLPLLVFLAAACGDNGPDKITIAVPAPWADAVGEMARLTPYPITVADAASGGFAIVVEDDAQVPAESYRVDADPADAKTWHVHAHDVLGAQYGVAAALESWGFRFRHPYDTLVASSLTAQASEALGELHSPKIRVRGLHIHTLHPIEGYFALWEPGNLDDAKRIIDWIIKNRGNYIQWAGLDDIINDPARYAAWKDYTKQIIDYAHARGVRVGFDMELFGQSNLQLAFDLSDDKTGTVPIADEIGARLPLVTDGLPFDVYDLSFGEFFDTPPDKFLAAVNEVAKQIRERAPDAEMHALVHVGFTQRVMYMGENIIYYFLVKYADPSIVPDIHSVMYYDLFEDAGGAYQHPDFSEHRQYLTDRMCADQPAAYHPEDAYWVAFDDSIPTFLPIYAHSRWLDLSMLAQVQCPTAGKHPLDEHLIFSSGWEWGYWFNDYVSLRASFEHGSDARAFTHAAFAPDLGDDAANLVDELADVQHDALIGQRLAAYLASRDTAIDAGRSLGIVSQPDRVTFDDLVSAQPADRDMFEANVFKPLQAMEVRFAELRQQADNLSLPDSRWSAELRDGFAVDALRAEFVVECYRATLAHLRGDDAAAKTSRDNAAAALDKAQRRIADRDDDLHDPHGTQITARTANQTFYQYGYLYNADRLCFWHRELVQVENILDNTSTAVPNCLL